MSSPTVRSSHCFWLIAALLFGGTLLLYSRGIGYGFTNYDDPRYVTGNAHVQAGLAWAGIRWAFVGNADYWHPLAWLSHMLDWQIYGENAAGHHLSSVLWHALNSVLLFIVLRRLTVANWTSALVAALFAWHPLRVESVIWIAERKDVLSGFFLLLTIWAYAAYTDRRRRRRRQQPAAFAYAAALGLFALDLMCKPTVVTLPLALLGLDYWPLRRWGAEQPSCQPVPGNLIPSEISGPAAVGSAKAESRDRGAFGFRLLSFGIRSCIARSTADKPEGRSPSNSAVDVIDDTMLREEASSSRGRWLSLVLEKLPFFALALVAAVVTIRMQQDIGAFTLDLPFTARLANAPVAIARYLGKFFWPADLAVCYPHPGWWPGLAVLAATGLVTAITAASWKLRRVVPWVLSGWVWFLALLLPTLGLVQVGFQSMADRYTYLPMIGWTIALLWSTRVLVTTNLARALAGSCAILALVATAAVTWRQQGAWRDSATLFRHAIAATGDNDLAEAFLGYTLGSAGDEIGAVAHSKRALAINPRNEMAFVTLAELHARQGKLDDAIREYRRSLELRPGDTTTEFALGLVLVQQGDITAASGPLRAAAQRDPSLVRENLARAETNLRAGRFRQAGLEFVAAGILEPKDAGASYGAGIALARLGRPADAAASFRNAIEQQPDFAPARLELGALLLAHHDPLDAAEQYRAVLARQPDSPIANVGLGRAEEQIGHARIATRCFLRALTAAPNDPEVNAAWAEVLARRGEFDAAVPFYRRATRLRPGDAGAHAGLGYALFLSHRPAEAIVEWKEALRLDPNFPDLRPRVEAAERGR